MTVVRSLEATGNASALTLRTLDLIASVLALSVERLLVGDSAAEPQPAPAEAAPVSELGAALLENPRGLSRSALLEALGCSDFELASSLTALAQLLRPIGLDLRFGDNRVTLVAQTPTVLDKDTVRDAVRRSTARARVDSADALLAYQAMLGTRSAKAQRGDVFGRLRSAKLANAGILVEPEKETVPMMLGEDVLYSLMISEAPEDA